MGANSFISLRSITKSYDKNTRILHKFNLDIEEGSFVTIIGSSGSGKTSILNLIAGFTKPEQGKILLNGIDVKDIQPNQRPTATVFQDYALFPHMNVFDNIAFGLKKMYTDLDQIPEYTFKKIHTLQTQYNAQSQEKIKRINKEIKKFIQLLIKHKKNYDLQKNSQIIQKIKNCYLKTIKNKIIDLDYWKSYWEYYPILMQKKLQEKYLQRPLNKKEIQTKVFSIINLIGLNGYEYSDVQTLSGGTKQKVALARSLVIEPKILLLDEPLSAIDKQIREKMQLELKRLHKKLKITFVLITHDQKEALVLSDKIVVLKEGTIQQIGTPTEIYDSPINPWVATFMGKANLFHGIYTEPGKILIEDKTFETDITEGFKTNENVIVMIRPEDYDVVEYETGIISVSVIDSIYKGQLWELKCLFYEDIIYVENIDEVKIGQKIGLIWDPMDVHVMKIQETH